MRHAILVFLSLMASEGIVLGQVCGDGLCDGGETFDDCPADCFTVGGFVLTGLDNPLQNGLNDVVVEIEGINGAPGFFQVVTTTIVLPGVWRVDLSEGTYRISMSLPGWCLSELVEGQVVGPIPYILRVDHNSDLMALGSQFALAEVSGGPCAEQMCSADSECDDNNICTTDACTVDNACSNAPVQDMTPCVDDDSCTENDACTDGMCGGTIIVCDDTNPCTTDSCVGGQCQFLNNNGACDDSDACTIADTCTGGACAGTPVVCDDGNVCTDDSCVSGQCEFATNAVVCDDNDACTTGDVCSEGACGGVLIDCDDEDACTTDACVQGVCQNEPTADPECCNDAGECADLDACTIDQCLENTCDHVPVDCPDDGLFCNGQESCDPATGTCTSSGEPCQTDELCCEDAGRCSECCDDDDCPQGPCMPGTCSEGVCVVTPIECPDDGLFCNGVEQCDPATDQCVSTGTPCGGQLCCEDSDTCAQECCQHAACNDGQNCTIDRCVEGSCTFEQVLCESDSMFCNGIEYCEPSSGACVSTGDPCVLVGVCCEDQLLCATECCTAIDCPGDACMSKTCAEGVCTSEDIECPDDGVFCNGVESCAGATGVCVSFGNPCGQDEVCCEETGGCVIDCCADDACDDDQACTEDVCDDGTCTNSSVVFDLNGDGIITLGGELPQLANCFLNTAFGDPEAIEACCTAGNCVCRLDCNGDGIPGIFGDLPCWERCFFTGDCTPPE